jgi:hypothetical protein
MMSFDPSGRFKLVDQAVMAPGRCLITQTPTGPFVDTGYDIKFSEVGRVYLSIAALREMAEGVGLFDDIRDEMAEQMVGIERRGFQEGIEDGTELAALADRLGDLVDRIRSRDVAADPAPEERAGDDEPAVLVTDFDREDGIGESTDDEPANPFASDGAGEVGRPAGVSSDPGDGRDAFRI